MLEMILSKTDGGIARFYEGRLLGTQSHELGDQLRKRLEQAIEVTLDIKKQNSLLQNEPVIHQSMAVRNPYTDLRALSWDW